MRQKAGVVVHQNAAYIGRAGDRVRTAAGDFEASFFVNAAGLYADRVRARFRFSEDYRFCRSRGFTYIRKSRLVH